MEILSSESILTITIIFMCFSIFVSAILFLYIKDKNILKELKRNIKEQQKLNKKLKLKFNFIKFKLRCYLKK